MNHPIPQLGLSESIGIASDRKGRNLKRQMQEFLNRNRLPISVTDFDCPEGEQDDEERMMELVQAVSSGELDRAVLFSSTGTGMAMLANKFPGIRAAVLQNPFDAELARRHFDLNVLCLGQFTSDAQQIITAWLGTPFEGGESERPSRHSRRLSKIKALERAVNSLPGSLVQPKKATSQASRDSQDNLERSRSLSLRVS